MKAQIINYTFMILLLAAHFSRAGKDVLVIVILLIPFLFFIKQRWVIQLLQGVAFYATLVWSWSTYEYVSARMANGDDWIRLLFILVALAVYSAWCGYYLLSDRVKELYSFNLDQAADDAETS
ncbi:MAG: hypothetical protein HOL70_02690 [Candidatus Marinimicrobia bacterium]|nr:hypothetical protein [Candidatus Neomarinimicrobiota bacterium]